jgi:hypothetical protein
MARGFVLYELVLAWFGALWRGLARVGGGWGGWAREDEERVEEG